MIALVVGTRSCFTAFSRTFAVAPCDSLRSPRLVINGTSFGATSQASGWDTQNTRVSAPDGVNRRDNLKLEYTKTLRPEESGGLVWRVRYAGEDFSVIIPAEVIEDIDEDFNQFNDPTWEMQEKAVSNRLHVFLQVIEGEISAGRASKDNRVVLTHDKFPPGTF